jgi:hypothetical protein
LGELRWNAMQEDSGPDVHIAPEQLLWRVRARASFEHLEAYVQSPSQSKFSLLRAFLRNEARLPCIRQLADVLAWHRLLLRALGSAPITREQAAIRTNGDVLSGLAESNRAEAEEVFYRFCSAFNSTLPELRNLYECQGNPFLTPQGEIDLSAGSSSMPVKMDEATPLHFSLPSHPPGAVADAPGLCTIQIMHHLVRGHNEICAEILAEGAGDEAIEDPSGTAMTVSTGTPASLLRRRLIDYDRERDFLPLLFEFSEQALGYGDGHTLHYDLEGLEAALASRLLSGKRPVALQVRHYLFAGEARARGGLAALQSILPQATSLPANIADGLRTELDTKEQVMQLLGLLEEAIHCLVAVGAPPGRGAQEVPLLATYLSNVALVSQERLAVGLPSSVEQQATLRHLRALFLFTEDRMHGGSSEARIAGSLLPSVPPRYRAELPEETKQELILACEHHVDLEAAIPALRDLLTGVLSDEATNYGAGVSLKLFLTYEDAGLEDLPVFVRHFPPGLLLEHAVEAFRIMSASLGADM